ncbi:olfactomedin-4-like [Pelodytes ibericus]
MTSVNITDYRSQQKMILILTLALDLCYAQAVPSTRREEVMDKISDLYLDLELLRFELGGMECLVMDVGSSLRGSNEKMESVFPLQVRNMPIAVSQLKKLKADDLLGVRREVSALRKRLEKSEGNQTSPASNTINKGTCNHGGIVNISKPFVVQNNNLGSNYKFGGWGKDSMLGAKQEVHWVAPLTTDARMINILRFYPSYDDLLLYKNPTEKGLTKNPSYNNYDYSSCGQGGGMIMFNNSMYYNCYNTRDICKFNVGTSALKHKTLRDAAFNNRFSYVPRLISLASDEQGLWVIYSTEQNKGNMVIGKLNHTTLTVEKTWTTSQYKLGETNAFMVCGVLYATRTLSTRREEIFYKYDTKTSEEGKMSIPLDKMMENVQSLSYNPNDHKLYMDNDGYQVTYNLSFN